LGGKPDGNIESPTIVQISPPTMLVELIRHKSLPQDVLKRQHVIAYININIGLSNFYCCNVKKHAYDTGTLQKTVPSTKCNRFPKKFISTRFTPDELRNTIDTRLAKATGPNPTKHANTNA
jgi:hypothetical protein